MTQELRRERSRPWWLLAGSVALSAIAGAVVWAVSSDLSFAFIAFLVVFITAILTIAMLVMTVDISALTREQGDQLGRKTRVGAGS